MEWGLLSEGQNEIIVNIMIGNFSFIALSCPFSQSWYPVYDAGGCNGNTANLSDAAQQINWRVNNQSCNSDIVKGPRFIWYNIQSTLRINSIYNLGWSKNYTTSSIWKGSSNSICLSPSYLEQLSDSCMWISNNEKPSFNYNLKNIAVRGNSITGIPPFYLHDYAYTYGIVNQDSDHRPRPVYLP